MRWFFCLKWINCHTCRRFLKANPDYVQFFFPDCHFTQIIASPCAWMEYNIPADCWQNCWSGIKYSAFLFILLPCLLTASRKRWRGKGRRSERQCVSYCSLEIRVLHIHSLDWLTSISWIVQIEVGMSTSRTGFWRLTSFRFDSRLSWIWRVWKPLIFSISSPGLQNISRSRPPIT